MFFGANIASGTGEIWKSDGTTAGTALVIKASASDVDSPANTLTFSLDPGAPTGAEINPTNGVFTWTPIEADAGRTNIVSVRVTDDGVPNLSQAVSFAIVVVSRPVIQSINITAENVTIIWSAVPGQIYRVQFKSDLTQAGWNDLTGDVAPDGNTAQKTDAISADQQRFYRVLLLP